jgi:hypothetical protein
MFHFLRVRPILACSLFLLSACASAPMRAPIEAPLVEGATRAERYAAVLAGTLDEYERRVGIAYGERYPSFSEAYRASRSLTDLDLTALLEERLEENGLTLDGLNAYARAHPDFVREQNRLYERRIGAIRERAFAVMARYDGVAPEVYSPPARMAGNCPDAPGARF